MALTHDTNVIKYINANKSIQTNLKLKKKKNTNINEFP
jgi:hypothetical protein